ncbi:uncharacterized protein LOC129757926 [Uranotaenia lowii]|uniref:uncharacterized protein LOC129757926 n=1 Tax=Uranotaenia lowii TaxID=190385 RepID=UPI00247A2A84|nr:uncharacterized protein LOC129757926 [Uranotaenia lowii]
MGRPKKSKKRKHKNTKKARSESISSAAATESELLSPFAESEVEPNDEEDEDELEIDDGLRVPLLDGIPLLAGRMGEMMMVGDELIPVFDVEDIIRVPPTIPPNLGYNRPLPLSPTSQRYKNILDEEDTTSMAVRYAIRRLSRRPRPLDEVPLSMVEPLVSYNRKMARMYPTSSLWTPEEQTRRQRAADLCPCNRVANKREGATEASRRPPTATATTRALMALLCAGESEPQPGPSGITKPGPSGSSRYDTTRAGPSKKSKIDEEGQNSSDKQKETDAMNELTRLALSISISHMDQQLDSDDDDSD